MLNERVNENILAVVDREPALTFIDLFAGIGGTRLGFEQAGFRCLFSSEWDKFARQTYLANFGETPHGDIRSLITTEIPEHDVLVAGFPCQPFSIAGVTKKNALGRPHGFLDQTQGTLFFEIARILRDKQPQAFLLENVRNLLTHDHGRTFHVIYSTLKELGYEVFYRIIDSKQVVPQSRQRIYMVGFKSEETASGFSWPLIEHREPTLGAILEDHVLPKYTLTDHLWSYLQDYAKKHRAAGNGFGFGLAEPGGISRTLSARYYKDGSEILIPQAGGSPRRLTPRECARLMGFPEDFKIVVSDTQAYKQFGNSVVVPIIESIARSVAQCLNSPKTAREFSLVEV